MYTLRKRRKSSCSPAEASPRQTAPLRTPSSRAVRVKVGNARTDTKRLSSSPRYLRYPPMASSAPCPDSTTLTRLAASRDR